jgi:geranylgeranyl pyrophosphate synthase
MANRDRSDHAVDAALLRVEKRLRRRVAADDGATEALRAAGRAHLAAGGGRTRARLTLAAADARGLDPADAEPAACAVELIHNASLVHDDLMDGDTTRRGRPTVWAAHGRDTALLLGDRLLALAFREAAETAAPAAMTRLLADRVQTLVGGQAGELTPGDLNAAGGGDPVDRYLAMAARKAGSLVALPVEAACALTDADAVDRTRAAVPFRRLGTAYQVRDDLADMTTGASGRAPGRDLAAGRIGAPAAVFLRDAAPSEADALLQLLADPARPSGRLAHWRRRLGSAAVAGATRRLHDRMLDDGAAAAAHLGPGFPGLFAAATRHLGGRLGTWSAAGPAAAHPPGTA